MMIRVRRVDIYKDVFPHPPTVADAVIGTFGDASDDEKAAIIGQIAAALVEAKIIGVDRLNDMLSFRYRAEEVDDAGNPV